MRRVVIAVIVGAVVGLGATWALLQERAAPGAPAAATGPGAEGPAAADELELPRVEDRARPGLWVTVRDSGHVVAGARVEAWLQLHDEAKGGVRWRPLGVEVSDASGRATFPAVRGPYAVRASAGGRSGLSLVEVVVADEPTVAQVTLGDARAVSGRVVDQATQAPVAGALVTAVALSSQEPSLTPWRFPAETHVTTAADSLGRFHLEVSAGLDVELHAQAAGYAHAEGEVVEAKAPPKELALELQRAAVAQGQVVDAAGQPLPGATVTSEPMESPPVTSDEAGRFALTLAPGEATVHAVSPGGLQGLTRVRAGAGEQLRDVRVVISASGDLSGRVVDAAGAPVAGVEVRVLAEPDSVEVALVQTDAKGAFLAAKLPAARYSLFARAGTGARGRLVSVEVPTPGPVELTLAPAAGLAGEVVNEAGLPLANAHVEVSWATGLGEPAVHARTDAAGHFELADLLPGLVSAVASLGEGRSEEAEVYLSAGQSASTRLAVVRRGHVKGRVLAPKPERFYVFPMLEGERDFWKRGFPTDDEGRFDEALAPGRYQLVASSPKAAFARPDAGVAVEVRAGETTLIDLPYTQHEDGELPGELMHPEVGSGLSFDTGPGGVAVSFVMAGCPAALAGVQQGDLVLSIDGEPVTKTLDAFSRLNRPRGPTVAMTVRRGGQDLELTLK